MFRFLLVLVFSTLMVGCFKSAELKQAEARATNYIKLSAAEYNSMCEIQAYSRFPVNMFQQVTPGTPAIINDCSIYRTSAAKSFCSAGNRPATPDTVTRYDVNLKPRNLFITECLKESLRNDKDFKAGYAPLKAEVDRQRMLEKSR
jgi:hypothetical protein